MIHIQRRRCGARLSDNHRRDSRHRAVRRDALQHDTARADFGTFADFNVSEDLRTSPDQNSAAYLGMSISRGLACSPQSYLVQQ